jgi:hypothetical protein
MVLQVSVALHFPLLRMPWVRQRLLHPKLSS